MAATAGEAPVRVYCASGAPTQPRDAPWPPRGDARPRRNSIREAGLDLTAILRHLSATGVTSVLVEGGSRTLAGFIRAGLADEFCFYFAPMLLGERSLPLVGDIGVLELAACPRLEVRRVRHLPPDWLFEGFFSGAADNPPSGPAAR